jgi:hypothetical protein
MLQLMPVINDHCSCFTVKHTAYLLQVPLCPSFRRLVRI